jgi:DtxR family Mn-dependent transcriptional regulator
MLQKLQKKGLVKYETYCGATLTQSGTQLARKLIKTHKIIADFLEFLGVKKEIAEHDACQIEHHISESTIDKLENFVNFIEETPAASQWKKHI